MLNAPESPPPSSFASSCPSASVPSAWSCTSETRPSNEAKAVVGHRRKPQTVGQMLTSGSVRSGVPAIRPQRREARTVTETAGSTSTARWPRPRTETTRTPTFVTTTKGFKGKLRKGRIHLRQESSASLEKNQRPSRTAEARGVAWVTSLTSKVHHLRPRGQEITSRNRALRMSLDTGHPWQGYPHHLDDLHLLRRPLQHRHPDL